MSERTREERTAEASAREAEEQAREAEEIAAKKAAAEKDEAKTEEEDEAQAEEKKQGPIGPWLSRSPESRLGLALAAAGVPLLAQLAPYVVEFEWRGDGAFELRLNRALEFRTDTASLAFEVEVSGRAGYDGLSELDGVYAAFADGGGAVERIEGEGESGPLVLQLAGLSEPIRMPQPDDSPDKTV